MLMPILKELFLWLYDIFLDIIGYAANALLKVMSTDLTYFEANVPAVKDMYSVFISVGWALLLGNMVFQAMKSMFSGVGFDGEDPAVLLIRTGIFSFLLVFSHQICNIGMGISKKVIDLLGIPTQISLKLPDESFFSGFDSSWMLVIIIGLLLGIQLVKLFLEIGERYVIVAILTLFAPVGFAMGGSKSTKDIFAGYIRMYASMQLMMVMNVVFLKLILSAMSVMPTGVMVLPWGVLVVGLAKAARKIDSLIGKIGLNPANTGDSITRGGIGMATMLAARMAISSVSRAGHSFHTSSRSTAALGTEARSTPKRPYGDSAGKAQAEHISKSGQPGNINTQSQQSSRFGSTGYVQNGQQSTAVQSTSNIGGSSGINYNRFGVSQINTGAPVSQQSYQESRGQAVSIPGSGSGSMQNPAKTRAAQNVSANIRQNPKTQPATASARFGSVSKNQKLTAPNRLQTNPAARQMPTGSIKLTPNFRKPPISNPAGQEIQNRAAEPQIEAPDTPPAEQPERKEPDNE